MPWVFEADVHCDLCTAKRFGPPEGKVDGEGNEVTRTDDPALLHSLCGTCGQPVDVEVTFAECAGFAWGASESVVTDQLPLQEIRRRCGDLSDMDDETWAVLFWEGFEIGEMHRGR